MFLKKWVAVPGFFLLNIFFSVMTYAAVSTPKIVAVVNKSPITEADIQSRIRLIMLTSGVKGETSQLRSQVLQALIDETLQVQAAKDKKITVSESDLNTALENMAKENHMTLDQMIKMLKGHQINKDTLSLRLKAQMSWVRYIRAMYGFLAAVSDAEIDKALKQIEESQTHSQYALAEIVLLVSGPQNEGRIRSEAQRIAEQVRSGASFSAMARQFSQDPSAVNGGDIGWVVEDQIDPAISSVVKNMQPGQVSNPIRTSNGFKVIRLREKKKPGEADPGETQISFCQAVFDVKPDTPEPVMAIVGPQIEEVLACHGCAAMKATAQKYNARVETSPTIRMTQLPDQLRQMLQTASVGKTIQPAMTPDGLVITMLCSKKQSVWQPPTRDQVSSMLEQEKLSKLASRDMMKLRATAFLDIKDPTLLSAVK